MTRGKVLPPRTGKSAPTTIGVIARLAAERAVGSGIDIAPLLREAVLPADLLSAPDTRIPVMGQIAFLDLAAEALGDDLLGFHLGREFDLRRLGYYYYAMASADRLSEGMAREERYSSVVNEAMRTTVTRNGHLIADYRYVGIERHLDRHQMEFWLTTQLRKQRICTGRDLVPVHVGLVHPRHGDVSEMTRFFGREIAFGAELDRMCFEGEAADYPFLTADPYLSGVLARAYEESFARQRAAEVSFTVRVENAVTPRLPHGTANIENVASDLGMSSRTLARRLAEEGATFRSMLEELRWTLADRYLRDRHVSISQIAWMLGYNEVSSFVRAVQRRTGKSPTEVRREYQSPDRSKEGT